MTEPVDVSQPLALPTLVFVQWAHDWNSSGRTVVAEVEATLDPTTWAPSPQGWYSCNHCGYLTGSYRN